MESAFIAGIGFACVPMSGCLVRRRSTRQSRDRPLPLQPAQVLPGRVIDERHRQERRGFRKSTVSSSLIWVPGRHGLSPYRRGSLRRFRPFRGPSGARSQEFPFPSQPPRQAHPGLEAAEPALQPVGEAGSPLYAADPAKAWQCRLRVVHILPRGTDPQTMQGLPVPAEDAPAPPPERRSPGPGDLEKGELGERLKAIGPRRGRGSCGATRCAWGCAAGCAGSGRRAGRPCRRRCRWAGSTHAWRSPSIRRAGCG